jgi:hypothetical protein
VSGFRRLTETLGAGPPPPGWAALADRPLVVIVGLTGVGKTTTLDGLDTAVPHRVLPNRRWLTDAIMIPEAAEAEGLALPVTDRAQRFRMTARYRAAHPGGMAELLAGLAVPAGDDAAYLFDGIRGANEAGFAAAHLPRAHFLALVAPDDVRLRRLLTRDDPFDGASSAGGFDRVGAAALLDEVDVIPATARPELLDWLAANDVSPADLADRLNTVAEERGNYDPAATVAALHAGAPTRLTVVDTTVAGPAEATAALAALLR